MDPCDSIIHVDCRPRRKQGIFCMRSYYALHRKGPNTVTRFSQNYLPGSHCVWQFFISAGSRLVMDTLDFDVFQGSSDYDPPVSSSYDSTSLSASKISSKDISFTEASLFAGSQRISLFPTMEHSRYPNEVKEESIISHDATDRVFKGEPKLLELQDLTKEQALLNQAISTLQKYTNVVNVESSDDLMHEKPMDLQAPFTEHFDGVKEQVRKVATSDVIDISSDSSTQLPALDLCPHDVLYITDLLTFSSRFCGSNSPLNKSLVFGSQVEKTEVIIELITTTNRGRGFAMFFHYENQTMVTSMGMQGRHGGESVMLLAVTTATISLALVLLLVLCLTYRQKMCPKRVQEPDQVIPQMTGNHNAALEVNELQLVVPDEELQIRELGSASQEEVTTEPSHPSLQEDAFSSIPAITDSHSDEVFIISAGKNTEGFTFTSYSLQEGNLKRSVTSPASVSDWLSSDYTSVDLGGEEKSNESVEIDPARQRTWSVRTFNSLLPPIPQLQMKWRSRTSSGSFTKLVDSRCTIPPRNPSPGNPRRAGSAVQMESSRLYSESSSSNASYPLTQSAQEQRKLPSCNLKKSRFASPYFGFLNGSSECLRNGKNISSQENHNLCQKSAVEFTGCSKSTTPRSVRVKDPSMDVETPKTVFVISEEADDQQPLVSDDRLNPSSDCVSEPRSIRCKADIHTVKSTRSLSDLSPWIQSTESYRYQYTENMLSGNPGDVCTTNVERQPQSGLATARLYLEHLQPV